jgi:hypothetical protein
MKWDDGMFLLTPGHACVLVFLMGWFEAYEMVWFLALVLLHPKPCNHNEDIHQRSIFVHSLVMIFHQHAWCWNMHT